MTGYVHIRYHRLVRASRLVAILLLLQARGGMTAAELARELEVSVRTIHRDVEALGAAGVPVYAERGPRGGIRLVDGYRTRLTGMTSDEAEALFLSGLPGPAAELGLGTVVAAARLKVLAALPPELRGRATRLLERFHLDAAGWYRGNDPVPHLAAIAECVWAGQRLELDYRRGDDVVTRTVDPLGIVLKAGTWYLVAARDDEIRTYRVSRVRGVERREERAVRPAGFDLADYWAGSTARYEQARPTVELVLRIRRDAGRRAAEILDMLTGAGPEDLPDPEPAEWRRCRVVMDWPDEVPGRLLSLGGDVEVLEPVEVRAEIAALAAAAAARYVEQPLVAAPAG
jgi:predicted DNA-binding transcriptional regulator YafY